MLNPKKPSYFYKLTAKQLEVDEDLVREVVDLYWSNIRKALSELKHHSVYAVGLGTFRIKFWELDEVKLEYVKRLMNNDGSSFRKMMAKNELEDRIEKILKIQEMLEEDSQKKQQLREKRYGKSNSNLEKPVTDTGGNNEHNPQEGSDRADISEEDEDM